MKFWISLFMFVALSVAGFWGGIEEAKYILFAWLGLGYLSGLLVWFMFFTAEPDVIEKFRLELFKNAKGPKYRLAFSVIASVLLAAAGHYILAILYMVLCYAAVEVFDKKES
jgi:hypothetical protein